MPDRARRIDRHTFSDQDLLFFDANVWLLLFPPVYRPPDARATLYSAAFKRAQQTGCSITIDALVLSEFVNTSARWAFQSFASSHLSFKAYRNSSAFRPVARSIADACRRILAVSTPIETGLTDCDIPAILDQFAAGHYDLNDHLLAALCRRLRFTLVTDDGDFRGSPLPILTANQKLLR
jgi:predicted nucleic acid-binding protein